MAGIAAAVLVDNQICEDPADTKTNIQITVLGQGAPGRTRTWTALRSTDFVSALGTLKREPTHGAADFLAAVAASVGSMMITL